MGGVRSYDGGLFTVSRLMAMACLVILFLSLTTIHLAEETKTLELYVTFSWRKSRLFDDSCFVVFDTFG